MPQPPQTTEAARSQYTLESLLRDARKHWPLLVGSTAFFAALAAGYTYFKRPVYESRASIILPVDTIPQSGIGALLGTGQGPSIYSVLVGIVDSESARTTIGKKVGLSPRTIERLLRVDDVDNTSQVIFTARHRSAQTAQAMVQTALETLDVMSQDLRIDRAGRQADTIKEKLDSATNDLRMAEAELLQAQQSSKSFPNPSSLDSVGELQRERQVARVELEKAKAELNILRESAERATDPANAELPKADSEGATVIGDLRAKLIAAKVELDQVRVRLGERAPEVARRRQEIVVLEQALKREQDSIRESVDRGVTREVVQAQSRVKLAEDTLERLEELARVAPSEFQKLRALFARVQGLNSLVTQLAASYQQELVSSEVKRVTWSILDKPNLPTEPMNKEYDRDIPLGAGVGLVIGGILVSLRGRKG